MTLTVCVGSTGSGNTTFLNDVHKSHKCTYIRQYHMIRPYIRVANIPNFDPSTLPYWDIYVKEGMADTIQVGGTMAGEFTAGLSGGQRKLLLFELIYQRTMNQSGLLILLDEPFAGVTDDFVPFIIERLNLMGKTHNILLGTNDHVETLKSMADNTVTVSAIDRTKLRINAREAMDRQKAIWALSVGDQYHYEASHAHLKFFYDVEIANNGALQGIAVFTTFCFLLFLATFWNSTADSSALVLVAGDLVGFYCVNPYLVALMDWRNSILEEEEALVHASSGLNQTLKTILTLSLVLIVAALEYGCLNAVISTMQSWKFFVGILFDSASMTFPMVCLGLYSSLPLQAVQILGSLPFLLLLFLSTTFSPGAGVPVLKELRYLFSRFYLWCMVPDVSQQMEGCPKPNLNILYLILSGVLGVVVFLFVGVVWNFQSRVKHAKDEYKRAESMDDQFRELLVELYGEKALRRFQYDLTSSPFSDDSTPIDLSDIDKEAVTTQESV